MCSDCKDEPACGCSSQECAASQRQYCAKCGHESSLSSLPATTSEPPPMGWLPTGHDVTPTYGKRLRQQSQAFIASSGTHFTFVPPPPYYESLLAMARALVAEHRTEHDYEVAVILCQMAAELVGEQVLERLIQERALTHVRSHLRGHRKHPSANLADNRVRDLYVDLSGHRIQDQTTFWPAFKAHVERRDRIVHVGHRVTKEEAQASCDAVAGLIEYLKQKHTLG